jgi:hypothetical protein
MTPTFPQGYPQFIHRKSRGFPQEQLYLNNCSSKILINEGKKSEFVASSIFYLLKLEEY